MSPEQGSSTSTSRRRPADAVVTVSVFVKLPRPGFVKTRLAAGVGDEAAAAFYRACAERTVDVVCRCPGVECVICYAPSDAGEEIRAWLGESRGGEEGKTPKRLLFSPQLDVPDLGARMRTALNDGIRRLASPSSPSGGGGDDDDDDDDDDGNGKRCHHHSRRRGVASLVVGSDIPDLQPSDVMAAVDAVVVVASATTTQSSVAADCVLGPAADGGFWIVGVARGGCSSSSSSSSLLPDRLFEGITWSTPGVFSAAAASAESCGLRLAPKGALRELADVDTVEDLVSWRKQRRTKRGSEGEGDGEEGSSLVSVVDEVLAKM